ncbi:16S rRNA (guanine(527)-N(7))-methyltransferase RsmG [Rhodococcus sp. X156]|uniref:16S rRNA (guanine(527)-N(7))-methyltransferase RsmG n=1 Tax=Rhodococcus sp. X156 TaxID=2499145 RepID=UPI000FDBB507|nr:16S rRNA (guanine(527)-N(7))-methyltransferase RsmG [Rhodococcus sp. X156]
MFHVKPRGVVVETDRVAAQVFGDRLPLAEQYAALLAGAGVERGLIGPREVDRIWDRHLLNCVVVQELLPESSTVVDVGSGAGLPGIPLAIARPDLTVVLVEPLLRRATFLQEAVDALGVSVTVHRGRAEEPATRTAVGGADVVVSRAVAPLGKLLGWCLPLARVGGRVLAMKGSSAEEEIERDRNAIKRIGGDNPRVLECGTTLLDVPTRVVETERLPGRGARKR